MSAAPRYDEMDADGRETSAESPELGTLVPQKHGGALLRGNPGNRGGGRRRDEVRALALEGAHAAVPKLVAMLSGAECEHCGRSGSDDQTVTRAADVLLKYGLGQQKDVSVENVRARVADTLDVIRRHAPPELAGVILAELRGVWT